MGPVVVFELIRNSLFFFVSTAAFASGAPIAKVLGVIGWIVSICEIALVWYAFFTASRKKVQEDMLNPDSDILNSIFGKETTDEEPSETSETDDN